jgi:hypothetical protein
VTARPHRARPVVAAALVVMALTHAIAPAADAQPRPAMRVLTLTSPAFPSGGLIPDPHTQRGRDQSPPLAWTGAPDSVKSYVLLVHDVDAAMGDGTDDLLHWLVWNIPGTATALPAGIPSGAQRPDGMRQVSVSGPYYRGPAAPATGPAHHYVFELYALDITLAVPPTGLTPAATRAAVLAAMAGHVRGKGVLVGRYQRPAP